MKPATSPPGSSPLDPEFARLAAHGLSIRVIQSPEDLDAAVIIQKDTWGHDFSDVVPASMMQITAKMGGVVAGAFDADGRLAGLVYGITGLRDGRLAHWSHMLAVRPEYRNQGIGQALKHYQKARLLEQGVSVMYWTFDPLVSRNAHLNLNRLGAAVDEYVPDMYGDSDSELHRLGTDRFIVKWNLDTPPGPAGVSSLDPDIPRVLTGGAEDAFPEVDAVGVGVPDDIEAVEAASFEEALTWRGSTRRAFTHYLGRGYRVTGFVPGEPHSFYVLTHEAGSAG